MLFRQWILLPLFMLLFACGSDEERSTNVAQLSIVSSPINGLYHIHGADSVIIDSVQVSQVTYTVTETNTNTITNTITHNDHTRRQNIVLDEAGDYTVEMLLEFSSNEVDISDILSSSVRDDSSITIDGDDIVTGLSLASSDDSNSGAVCNLYCGKYAYSTDGYFRPACFLAFEDECDSTFSLPLYNDDNDDYLEHVATGVLTSYGYQDTVDDGSYDLYLGTDSEMCIRVIGGAGRTGSGATHGLNHPSGGDGGNGGLAQIVTTRTTIGSEGPC